MSEFGAPFTRSEIVTVYQKEANKIRLFFEQIAVPDFFDAPANVL